MHKICSILSISAAIYLIFFVKVLADILNVLIFIWNMENMWICYCVRTMHSQTLLWDQLQLWNEYSFYFAFFVGFCDNTWMNFAVKPNFMFDGFYCKFVNLPQDCVLLCEFIHALRRLCIYSKRLLEVINLIKLLLNWID